MMGSMRYTLQFGACTIIRVGVYIYTYIHIHTYKSADPLAIQPNTPTSGPFPKPLKKLVHLEQPVLMIAYECS